MISVVCIYNNEKIMNDYLLKSLKNQIVNFELITLDNTEGKFKSAAEALNHGGKQAKGRYMMFVHQDVYLCSTSWLRETEKILDSLANLGIAGIAGMSEKENSYRERQKNIIAHGDPPTIRLWGNLIQKPEQIQTLDECLILIPRLVFNILRFDEKICDNWHLYGIDYCLSIKKLGFNAYVIPMFIQHKSIGISAKGPPRILKIGSLSEDYWRALRRTLKKHRSYYKRVYTTCGDWDTAYPVIMQRAINYIMRKLVLVKKFGSSPKSVLK